MKLTVPVGVLKAALIAAAKEDVRYYLNAVYIKVPKKVSTPALVISTDGHRLHVISVGAYDTDRLPGEVIVPRKLVEAIVKGAKKPKSSKDEMTVTIECLTMVSLTRSDGLAISDNAVGGEFPNIPKAIPKEFSGEAGQYNPDYVADFRRAVEAMDGTKPWSTVIMHPNGRDGALGLTAQGNPHIFGLVMPMRVVSDEAERQLSLDNNVALNTLRPKPSKPAKKPATKKKVSRKKATSKRKKAKRTTKKKATRRKRK